MRATYVEHMGNDLSVVNAARVSFGKEKQEFDEKDARLLRYLAKHRHELPFAHPHVTFHFEAPIFVARQLAKHQVGFVWSEISRRYVTGEPKFWGPEGWRKVAADKKQGSSEEIFQGVEAMYVARDYKYAVKVAIEEYEKMIQKGVCPEQARAVLPQGVYTEWRWTGSLLGWARVWGLRVKPDAQKETRELVEQIGPKMAKLFPVSWKVLTERIEDEQVGG